MIKENKSFEEFESIKCQPDVLKVSNNSFGLYDKVTKLYKQFYFNKEALSLEKPFFDKFISLLPTRPQVLEVGCGITLIPKYLSERGVVYIGIDASPRMISNACRLNPGINFKVSDMRYLPDDIGYFDGVISIASIIHYSNNNLPNLLHQFARVTAKDGLILLSVEEGHGEVIMDFGLGLNQKILVSLYSLSDLENVLQDLQFRIIFHSNRKPSKGEFPFPKLYIIAKRNCP